MGPTHDLLFRVEDRDRQNGPNVSFRLTSLASDPTRERAADLVDAMVRTAQKIEGRTGAAGEATAPWWRPPVPAGAAGQPRVAIHRA